MSPEQIKEFLQELWGTPQGLYSGIGVCLFLLVLLVAFIARPRKAKALIAFEDGSGSVSVSRAAIDQLVQSACAQIDSINHPKVYTQVKKGIPTLKIKLKVEGDVRMRDVRDDLRETLRTQLMENLGFRKIGNIDILVTSVGSVTIQRPAAAPVSASTTDFSEPTQAYAPVAETRDGEQPDVAGHSDANEESEDLEGDDRKGRLT